MVKKAKRQEFDETVLGRVINTLSLSVSGFYKILMDIIPYEGNSILIAITLPVLLAFPVAAFSVFLIVDAGYTWSSDLHVLLTPVPPPPRHQPQPASRALNSPSLRLVPPVTPELASPRSWQGIGFLVVFRCTTAFNRFWEARGHIGKAIKACRTLSIIVITQYHRHAGKPGEDIPKAVDDVRRYLLLYFHTMINELQRAKSHSNVEDFVTTQELSVLKKRKTGQAVTALKWVGARLAYLESLGYLSPLQLHETNESLTHLIEAFNGLTKIKTTPVPFPIRQLCSLLTVIYVRAAPRPSSDAHPGRHDTLLTPPPGSYGGRCTQLRSRSPPPSAPLTTIGTSWRAPSEARCCSRSPSLASIRRPTTSRTLWATTPTTCRSRISASSWCSSSMASSQSRSPRSRCPRSARKPRRERRGRAPSRAGRRLLKAGRVRPAHGKLCSLDLRAGLQAGHAHVCERRDPPASLRRLRDYS